MGPNLAGDRQRAGSHLGGKRAISIIRLLSRTWRNLAHRARLEADLDAELRAYVDLAAGHKIKSGMSPAEARRAALIESGGVEQVKERVRDVRAGNLLETVIRDVRFGARLLAKNRGFTAAAVIMLALGIGANTAVFSVVNAVLLRGLPYAEPDRIVALYEKRPFISVPCPADEPENLSRIRGNADKRR